MYTGGFTANMKKFLIAALLLCAFAMGQSRPRMVYQGTERVHMETFDYFHDTETKQEVVCVFGSINVASCYLTGRTW